MPNMGTKEKPSKRQSPQRVADASLRYALRAGPSIGLADALFTTGQQRVLGLLFGQPQRSFTVSDIIAATGAGSGAAQREVAKLLESGLVTMRPVGTVSASFTALSMTFPSACSPRPCAIWSATD